MTEISSASNSSTPRRQAARAWICMLIVALIIGGGGWFLWKQWIAEPDVGEAIDVGSGNTRRGLRGLPRAIAPPPMKEGVNLLGAGLYRVKAGDFSMNLSAKNADIRVFYDKNDLLPPEQVRMLQARRDVVGNATRAAALDVTVEQVKLLKDIPAGVGGGMKITKADRERLKAVWESYNSAAADAKAGKEVELLATLREIGQNSLAPTRQQYSDRVEKVKAIFTPKQLEQLAK